MKVTVSNWGDPETGKTHGYGVRVQRKGKPTQYVRHMWPTRAEAEAERDRIKAGLFLREVA